MKLYISADMEGISGITDYSFVVEGDRLYTRGQRLMTGDINHVARAAFEQGCSEILVNDSHRTMANILIEELDPRVQLISGAVKPLCMMEGLDETFAGACLVGFHAKASHKGVLNHTMANYVKNVYVNDFLVGEVGLNAYLAGCCQVPVWLVTGDDQVAEEAAQLIPGVTTAVVKTCISRVSARCLSPERSAAVLREKTMEALANRDRVKPLLPPAEPELRVEFCTYSQAEWAAFIPGSVLEPDSTAVRYQAKHFPEAYKALLAMLRLAAE